MRFEKSRFTGCIEGSVTYSRVRLTRSSRSPSGVIECQSLSPLKRISVPGSVVMRISTVSRLGSSLYSWQTRRLEECSMSPTRIVKRVPL